MESSETTGVVWEALAKATDPYAVEHLVDDTGCSPTDVRKALARLREARLVAMATERPSTYYIIRELDALRWAKAVDMGVPLSVLERYGRLAPGVRTEALKLATSGELEVLDQQRIQIKRQHRERLLAGRAASRAAMTDLARLVEDTRSAVRVPEADGVSADSKAVQARRRAVESLLQQAVSEAERALKTMQDSLR